MNLSPWKRLAAGLSVSVLVFSACLFGFLSFTASSHAENLSNNGSNVLEPGEIIHFNASNFDMYFDGVEQPDKISIYNFLPNNFIFLHYDEQTYSVQVDVEHGTLQLISNSLADSKIPPSLKYHISQKSSNVHLASIPHKNRRYVQYISKETQYPDGNYNKSYVFPSNSVFTLHSHEYFATVPAIAISPDIPTDIPGGATNPDTNEQGVVSINADLTTAAAFAWQEFIALNWPNESLSNGAISRETPDKNAVFGSSFQSSLDKPLVWESLRHKAEIFPGCQQRTTDNDPTCYVWDTPLSQLNYQASELAQSAAYNESALPDYDELPNYSSEYSIPVNNGSLGSVPGPCSGSAPTRDAWVNLDETNEIGEANMFAGVLPASGPVDRAGDKTNISGAYANQQFLYLAKGNRKEYDYVKTRGWNLGDPTPGTTSYADAKTKTVSYLTSNKKYPKTEQTDDSGKYYMSFPDNTIEIKSAWRQINSDEVGKFHTAPVRYYTEKNGTICYEQPDAGAWGMAALHVIHKTPSAPYFIFATFSQVDNLLSQDGTPVEDANGRYIGTPPANPTTPDIKADTPGQPPRGIVYETPASGPKQVNWQSFNFDGSSLPQDHETADKRLYYTNTSSDDPGNSPPSTPISVNKRQIDIPDEVIAVNQAAHDAIRAYNEANGLSDSPWLHYKLVNVQWVPSTKAEPGPLYVKNPGKDQNLEPSTYYLANEVVETDFNLQFFSGQFQPKNFHLATDFANAGQEKFADEKGQYFNVVDSGKAFNMGGCMGCHGVAANAGADFSFILNSAGKLLKPEDIGNADANNERLKQTLEVVASFTQK